MRVNLYGGPGSGKSKLAHFLADQLGRDGFNIELAQEVIKPRAYRKDWPTGWENFTNIMAPQMEREREWLESGVKVVVTDSPIFLQCYYMAARNAPPTIGALQIARAWEESFPAINVFLERSTRFEFEQAGRYQDKKDAERIDATLTAFLDTEGVACERFDAFDRDAILDHVRTALRDDAPSVFRAVA